MQIVEGVSVATGDLMSRVLGAFIALGLAALSGAAEARHINIVALGDSNFGAPGVSRSEAYPAQVERLLRARGLDVSVANEGVNGDTTHGVMSRLGSAVPDGTDVVLLSIGINDWVYEHTPVATIRAQTKKIAQRLRARGIIVVVFKTGGRFQGSLFKNPKYHVEALDNPGLKGPPPGTTKWHLTGAGYAIIARQTLPQVLAAIAQAQKRQK